MSEYNFQMVVIVNDEARQAKMLEIDTDTPTFEAGWRCVWAGEMFCKGGDPDNDPGIANAEADLQLQSWATQGYTAV